ncbi:MAG: 2-dehydropantoate 2-reductase [Burkholderiaceae bacterium]
MDDSKQGTAPDATDPAFPRVAVMGAGAVGCYYGGMMALAGADVTLIARPAHAEAINRSGLWIEGHDIPASSGSGRAASRAPRAMRNG